MIFSCQAALASEGFRREEIGVLLAADLNSRHRPGLYLLIC